MVEPLSICPQEKQRKEQKYRDGCTDRIRKAYNDRMQESKERKNSEWSCKGTPSGGDRCLEVLLETEG